ncbi:MAG: GntR family transcriptional regulator [Gammaproteobacteria bacterium]
MIEPEQRESGGPLLDLINRLQLSDRTSEPVYLQLKRQLNDLIEAGELETGYNLPSERVLAEALQVSRTTVKRCYDELRGSRRLSTHGRGGTVVQGPPRVNPTMGKLKGFTEEMREQGKAASTRVLEYEVVHERTIACIFQRPSAAAFLRLVRVRLADNVPMTREVAWYDLTAAPALEDWDTRGSIYTFLHDKCGIQLAYADQSIEAVMCSAEEAEVFGFDAPSPCLLLKRHTYSTTQQLIEYVEGTFRGDAYVYKLKLQS